MFHTFIFKILTGAGHPEKDLACKTPMVQARKQTRIPLSGRKKNWTHSIGAIDRGNPKGKRDYAIIFLACVLGLRLMISKTLLWVVSTGKKRN